MRNKPRQSISSADMCLAVVRPKRILRAGVRGEINVADHVRSQRSNLYNLWLRIMAGFEMYVR